MADFVVYYHSFWDADQKLKRHRQIREYHSDSQPLYDGVGPGDRLWLVVLSGPKSSKWRLRSMFVIKEKRDRPGLSPWGRYEFIGEDTKTKTFRIDTQLDFATILKSLKFKTDNPITADGSKIGNAIQSPRALSPSDVICLMAFTEKLDVIEFPVAKT